MYVDLLPSTPGSRTKSVHNEDKKGDLRPSAFVLRNANFQAGQRVPGAVGRAIMRGGENLKGCSPCCHHRREVPMAAAGGGPAAPSSAQSFGAAAQMSSGGSASTPREHPRPPLAPAMCPSPTAPAGRELHPTSASLTRCLGLCFPSPQQMKSARVN